MGFVYGGVEGSDAVVAEGTEGASRNECETVRDILQVLRSWIELAFGFEVQCCVGWCVFVKL